MPLAFSSLAICASDLPFALSSSMMGMRSAARPLESRCKKVAVIINSNDAEN